LPASACQFGRLSTQYPHTVNKYVKLHTHGRINRYRKAAWGCTAAGCARLI